MLTLQASMRSRRSVTSVPVGRVCVTLLQTPWRSRTRGWGGAAHARLGGSVQCVLAYAAHNTAVPHLWRQLIVTALLFKPASLITHQDVTLSGRLAVRLSSHSSQGMIASVIFFILLHSNTLFTITLYFLVESFNYLLPILTLSLFGSLQDCYKQFHISWASI